MSKFNRKEKAILIGIMACMVAVIVLLLVAAWDAPHSEAPKHGAYPVCAIYGAKGCVMWKTVTY